MANLLSAITGRRPAVLTSIAAAAAGLGLLLLSGFAPAGAQDIDMEKIFGCADQTTLDQASCEAGRELLLSNCIVCHSFVQIVLRQYDANGWSALLNQHRIRVAQLSDDQVKQIHDYLTAKFNPDRPVPDLPPEIIKDFVAY